MPPAAPSSWHWDELSFLARPGILFTFCLWVHSLLVYLLVLHEASATDLAALRARQPHADDIERARFRWHKRDLKDVIRKFQEQYADQLTATDQKALDRLQEVRNIFAHCFFSLPHLVGEDAFVSYIPRHQPGEETVCLIPLTEDTLHSLLSELKPLTLRCQALAAALGVDLRTLP